MKNYIIFILAAVMLSISVIAAPQLETSFVNPTGGSLSLPAGESLAEFSAVVKNVGDASSFNVELVFSVPSEWTITFGSLSEVFSEIAVGAEDQNTVGFIVPGTFPVGSYLVSATSSGQNSNGDSLPSSVEYVCVGVGETPNCAPIPAEVCTDGVDNDQDGQIDCADSDCASDAACQIPAEVCTDGVDNDQDGQIDCADSDCASDVACQVADEDGDGILDENDKCPNSIMPENLPESRLDPNHYAQLDTDSAFEVNTGTAKNPVISDSDYTMADTNGCTCTQILAAKPGKDKGEISYGCTKGVIKKSPFWLLGAAIILFGGGLFMFRKKIMGTGIF